MFGQDVWTTAIKNFKLNKMNAVIIDDDIFFSELLSNKLKTYGFNTLKKIETFDELRNQKFCPEVFFIDFHLRGTNCNKIIRYIETKYEEASIILMSDNDNAMHLLESRDVYLFIPKSKIKYLKYKINIIKNEIQTKKQIVLKWKSISIFLPIFLAYVLLYILLN